MTAKSYSGFVQKYNMMVGVLTIALITSILFIIMPFGILFMADIFLVVGGSIGLYFTFKNKKESQSHIKTGIIVGLVGSVFSLFLISFFDWILYSVEYGFNFLLFLEYTLFLFLLYGIMYVFVGIVVGYLFGRFYRKREIV
jgi:hypothetical protein